MVSTTTAPPCPQCGSAMLTRRGGRGEFLGCSRYPECRGTRPITEVPGATRPSAGVVKSEQPGPTGALLTDLRAANGYVAKAIDILRRRQAEIDQLVNQHNGATS
jgi:ssDNA-binding Zn-finger/Zn-ribbon topoisomerase 1